MARVLFVDDDPVAQKKAEEVLRDFELVTAETAQAAMQLLQEQAVDVVLCALTLPDASGLELLREVRRRFPSTRVILLSTVNDVMLAVEAMRLGAFYFLVRLHGRGDARIDEERAEALRGLVRAAMTQDQGSEADALARENLRLRREIAELRGSTKNGDTQP